MKQVTRYESDDGILFENEWEAHDHEKNGHLVNDILQTWDNSWDNFDVYVDSRVADEMARIIVEQYDIIKKL
jgi:hypothetical protein